MAASPPFEKAEQNQCISFYCVCHIVCIDSEKSNIFDFHHQEMTVAGQIRAPIMMIIIVLKSKEDKSCMLINMAVPSDRNIPVKKQSLEVEIARMRGLKTQIGPVVIGPLGVIKESIDKQVSKIMEISTSPNCERLLC